MLTTIGLSKYFGRLAALEKVDVTIQKGQIHGLIGPNGSGKSTFVNVVSGLLPATEGKIFFNGIDITRVKSNVIAAEIGTSRTFQLGQVLPRMTCLQNVMVGGHGKIKNGIAAVLLSLPFKRTNQEKELKQRSLELMELVGLADKAEQWADDLGWTDCQLLQIARALANEPEFLMLDEPTGGMGIEESKKVAGIIRAVRDKGTTVMVISHDMDLVMGIADWITVLESGQKICEGIPTQVAKNPRVIEAYLGAEEKSPTD